MAKYYKIEVQTMKDGTTATVPNVVYENPTESIAADAAAVGYHQAVAYNLQQSETLRNFLVCIMTETGYIDPKLKTFHNFEIPVIPEVSESNENEGE